MSPFLQFRNKFIEKINTLNKIYYYTLLYINTVLNDLNILHFEIMHLNTFSIHGLSITCMIHNNFCCFSQI